MPVQCGIYTSKNSIVTTWDTATTNAVATTGSNPGNAVNYSLSLTGAANGWLTTNTTNQRFTMILNIAKYFNQIRICNYHDNTNNNNYGIKSIRVYIINSASTQFGGGFRSDSMIYSNIVQPNHIANQGANYQIINLGRKCYGRFIALDIYSNWGSTNGMGIRRIQVGLSNETNIMPSIVFDSYDFTSAYDNFEKPIGLGNRIYTFKSTDKSGSIDCGNSDIRYDLYNTRPGFTTVSSANNCFFNLQGINTFNNVWHIVVTSLNGSSTNVGGGGDNYLFASDSYAISPNNDRIFIRWGWNKFTSKLTIQAFVSSSGVTTFSPFDVYGPMPSTGLVVLACKIYNRTDGQTGTAIDYITPANPNQITKINYSPNIIRAIDYRPLAGGVFTNSFLSPFVLHEASYNDTTDSNILSKVAYLRNKWNAI